MANELVHKGGYLWWDELGTHVFVVPDTEMPTACCPCEERCDANFPDEVLATLRGLPAISHPPPDDSGSGTPPTHDPACYNLDSANGPYVLEKDPTPAPPGWTYANYFYDGVISGCECDIMPGKPCVGCNLSIGLTLECYIDQETGKSSWHMALKVTIGAPVSDTCTLDGETAGEVTWVIECDSSGTGNFPPVWICNDGILYDDSIAGSVKIEP